MKKTKIAFIKAAWHDEIVNQCEKAFRENLNESVETETFTVPGSLEIPLMAQNLANSGKYKVICCAGFVTDGGIYRHEFVAQAVLNGMMEVQLKTGVPVLSAVLTPQETFAEDGSNAEQYDFFYKHMLVKGKELANSCLATIENYS